MKLGCCLLARVEYLPAFDQIFPVVCNREDMLTLLIRLFYKRLLIPLVLDFFKITNVINTHLTTNLFCG